jgi:hypothetical protein
MAILPNDPAHATPRSQTVPVPSPQAQAAHGHAHALVALLLLVGLLSGCAYAHTEWLGRKPSKV